MERAYGRHINLAAGGVGNDPLTIGANLPGLAIEVKAVLWVAEPGTALATFGLGHNLGYVPVSSEDIMGSIDYWIMSTVYVGGVPTVYMQLPEPGFLIAGPQLFSVHNGESSLARDFSVTIYYETRRMSVVDWTLLHRRTSFREGE